ncbi:hypothetical protein MLD38_035044 [Melastoma candidum]|uniref:Uncharacterized protein n=1 Tax=Melastoma candidum TaxID=119954 RepID=A0ACB9MDY0_9MYRT|nr:hypothetical protein MLD38_035044 [Melastoma candidum]
MASSSIWIGVAIAVALILLQSHPLAAREVPEPPVPRQPHNPMKVALINQVGTDLTFHCQLNFGEDLGSHALSNGQGWEYSFKPRYDWINVMTCSFQWLGQVRDFDAYDQTRDVRFIAIYWTFGTDGACRTLEDSSKQCYHWK